MSSLRCEGGKGLGVPERHGSRQPLCGGSARGQVPCGGSTGEAEVLRFGRRSRRHQNRDASVCRCRFNSLMAQMADRAGIGRGSCMMVPGKPQRCPYQQRKERHRDQQSPDCSSTRHFRGVLSKRLLDRAASLVQNFTLRAVSPQPFPVVGASYGFNSGYRSDSLPRRGTSCLPAR
jgi:hypothetical protein